VQRCRQRLLVFSLRFSASADLCWLYLDVMDLSRPCYLLCTAQLGKCPSSPHPPNSNAHIVYPISLSFKGPRPSNVSRTAKESAAMRVQSLPPGC
jgi:hypothetical protein